MESHGVRTGTTGEIGGRETRVQTAHNECEAEAVECAVGPIVDEVRFGPCLDNAKKATKLVVDL